MTPTDDEVRELLALAQRPVAGYREYQRWISDFSAKSKRYAALCTEVLARRAAEREDDAGATR